MKLGTVVGKVWAVNKAKELAGCRLLLVQPESAAGKAVGDELVVADPGNIAGDGDRVVYVTNTDAAQAFPSGVAPVNASVVELVDYVD
jgi:microcompartment protein CcmK/EutM